MDLPLLSACEQQSVRQLRGGHWLLPPAAAPAAPAPPPPKRVRKGKLFQAFAKVMQEANDSEVGPAQNDCSRSPDLVNPVLEQLTMTRSAVEDDFPDCGSDMKKILACAKYLVVDADMSGFTLTCLGC